MLSLLLAFIGTFSGVLPKSCAKLAWLYFCYPVNKSKVNYDLFPPNFSQHIHSVNGKLVYSYHWVPDYYHSTCCVVHGWGGYTGSMRRLIEAMLASNIAVVAVDIAAHGASSGRLSNLAIYRDCVAEIWNHYEQIDSFVGHSIGGTTVALLCSQLTHHPNIDRLKSIVMMSSPNSIEAMAKRFLARINADPVSEPYFLEQIEKVAQLPMNRLSIQQFLETVPAQHIAVIHDKFDEVIPYQEALDIKASCDRVVLETTENLAHNRIYRDKDVISKTVHFISESALA